MNQLYWLVSHKFHFDNFKFNYHSVITKGNYFNQIKVQFSEFNAFYDDNLYYGCAKFLS